MLASERGANVKLIGLVYNSTSQVFVVNADKIKSYADFKKQENAIALNSRGDFIYVLLSGVLGQNDIAIDDTTIVELGGSGSRMRALLGGRVAAVPVHFDQAEAIVKQGNYKVLIEPCLRGPAQAARLPDGLGPRRPFRRRADGYGGALQPQSVASHTLYENADPFLITEPNGVIDALEARYEALNDRAGGSTTRNSGRRSGSPSSWRARSLCCPVSPRTGS